MHFFRRFKVVIVLSFILVISASWGFLVHKTLHQIAVYELPEPILPFFYQNMDYIVMNAPRPDMRRNQDSTEANKHFIDIEDYKEHTGGKKIPEEWQEAIKVYSKDSLLKYGYLPYHIIYMKGKLTQAFKSGNKDSILFYATDMGHYIGDANVPLHTTNNYDGQMTNQKGLHSLWETTIPDLELESFKLYSGHTATYLKNPVTAVWQAIWRAEALVPIMLQKEKEVSAGFTDAQKFRTVVRRGTESKTFTNEFAKAYSKALNGTVNEQLLHSADLIADFWYTCWVDAGKPDLSAITPGWTQANAEQLKNELAIFSANKLAENKLLLSRKPDAR